MRKFIGHNSALYYWRMPPDLRPLAMPSSSVKLLPGKSLKSKDIHIARLHLDLEYRPASIHMLVPGNHDGSPIGEKATFHSWSGSISKGSFLDVGFNVLVSSPEFLFLQMAPSCSFATLVELGFELCGGYAYWHPDSNVSIDIWPSSRLLEALDPLGPSQGSECAERFSSCAPPLTNGSEPANNALSGKSPKGYYARSPLTSVARIGAFINRAEGAYGARLARRALAYVRDNSASPQETKLAMTLGLPCKYGGCGLGMPNMNESIPISPKDRRRVSKSAYRCDLYWPRQRVAVEYDSSEHHLTERRVAEDSQRRADLSYLGVDVVSITKRQARNNVFLVRTAAAIAKKLGKRVRPRGRDYAKTCMELRANLFYGREIEELHLQ